MGAYVRVACRLGWVGTTIAAVGAIIVATGISVGQIWSRSAPEYALLFWPHASEAEAQRAAFLVSDLKASSDVRRQGEALSRAAIARNPTNVVAVRTRGLLAGLSADDNTARRWMRHSETLSRRDLPTQIWLIEDAVTRGDVDQALVHYNRALLTSKRSWELLFPVLIAAATDPKIADALSRRLASRPAWWGPFMNRLIGETQSPATLVLFSRRIGLTPSDAAHPDFFGRILERLVTAGDFARADGLYRSTITTRDVGPLRDGGFERDDGVLPFAWRLAGEGDLNARIESRPDGAPGRALVLDARGGRSGEVARQALPLTPGGYLLRGQAAEVGGDDAPRPVVRLRCGSGSDAELAQFRLPPAGTTPSVFSSGFNVPGNCHGVWFGIEVSSELGAGNAGGRPWVDNLVVTRVAASSGAPG